MRISTACIGVVLATLVSSSAIEPSFTLQSSAFKEGDLISSEYTCDGRDFPPPLSWSDPPAGTKSFALMLEDPDSPGGLFVHWIIFNLRPDRRRTLEGVNAADALSDGAIQATNSLSATNYDGPCPPTGVTDHYFFRLFALDAKLPLGTTAKRDDVIDAMRGHVLAEASLMGLYQRVEPAG